MPVTVACVGIATLDRVWFIDTLPGPSTKLRSRAYLEVGGGQAANAAVAAARLGARTKLWSAVGSDAAGTEILAELRAEQVDVAGVQIVAGARSVTAAVLVEASGERSIIADFDHRLHAALPALDLAAVARTDVVLADVKWVDAAEQALRAARHKGIPTVLDVEPAPQESHALLCPLADHAIFGQSGLAAYTGTGDPSEGLRCASRRLGGTVGVTLGAQGVKLLGRDGEIHVPAPRVDVVDTNGAGDAFHGAYAVAIAEGLDAVAAARLASAAAALKCTKPGGRAGLPSRKELDQFMETRR